MAIDVEVKASIDALDKRLKIVEKLVNALVISGGFTTDMKTSLNVDVDVADKLVEYEGGIL